MEAQATFKHLQAQLLHSSSLKKSISSTLIFLHGKDSNCSSLPSARMEMVNNNCKTASVARLSIQKTYSHVKDDSVLLRHSSSLPSLMLWYAKNGMFSEAQSIWFDISNSCFVPDVQLVSELITAYAKLEKFDEIVRLLHQLYSRGFKVFPDVYFTAINCFGEAGQLGLMENTLKQLLLQGFTIDPATANAFVRYYSIFGSLTEMENAYGRFKRSRFLIDIDAIRAISLTYIKRQKFFELGEFVRDVGLRRRNVGNLLWNLLLLSYASNFKMKSLQREFLNMVEAGFSPDATTFNIRSLAFSRMSMFWDLHLSLEHLKHENVNPDLVTYGCVADAYFDRRLGKNLMFALRKFNIQDAPVVSTDEFVFEAMGKGDFHLSSEAHMEFSRQRKWTYRDLLAIHARRQYRSNQIFWNY